MFYFKIIIFICFVVFYYLGIKNNYIGFLKSKSQFDSIISAIGFFTFSIVMLECFIFYFSKKIKWLFLIVFVIMFSTNFLTILDGQYHSFKNIVNKDISINNELLTTIENKIIIINNQLKNFELELHRENNKEIITKSVDYNIRNLTYNLIPKAQKELIELTNQKEDLIKITPKIEKTFLDNIYLQTFRFIVTAFAMELVASISLAFIFLMRTEKEK